jgi:hypothetical protein
MDISPNLRGAMPALLRWNRGGVATPAGSLTVHGANWPNPWANRANSNLFKQRTTVTDANLVVGDYQHLSNIPFAAFANYNWIAVLGEFTRLPVEIGATLGAVITSGTGAMARLDFTSETDTGDGATTVFDLAADFDLTTHLAIQVKVNAIVQAASAFTITNNAGKIRITFAVAPGNTLAIIYQFYPKAGKEFGLSLVTPVSIVAAGVVPNGTQEITTKDLHWIVTGAGVTGSIDAAIEVAGR